MLLVADGFKTWVKGKCWWMVNDAWLISGTYVCDPNTALGTGPRLRMTMTPISVLSWVKVLGPQLQGSPQIEGTRCFSWQGYQRIPAPNPYVPPSLGPFSPCPTVTGAGGPQAGDGSRAPRGCAGLRSSQGKESGCGRQVLFPRPDLDPVGRKWGSGS